ncbi:unnamed protein product [Spodoptera exigua]|nr:unnamed protein product [Spodoptera exigua]
MSGPEKFAVNGPSHLYGTLPTSTGTLCESISSAHTAHIIVGLASVADTDDGDLAVARGGRPPHRDPAVLSTALRRGGRSQPRGQQAQERGSRRMRMLVQYPAPGCARAVR